MPTKLRVIDGQRDGNPPRKLGKHGGNLWRAVMTEYQIADAGGLEMLASASQALDRAERCRDAIDHDGEIIRGKNGMREHPLLRHELAARAFVVRTLHKLGLDLEAIKPNGRPARGLGWIPDADD
jgi:hypothetical protein